jgi:hypothetical protein
MIRMPVGKASHGALPVKIGEVCVRLREFPDPVCGLGDGCEMPPVRAALETRRHFTCSDIAEVQMAENEDDDMVVVPIPGEENEAERRRIRESNDRDQEMERRGEQSRHNRGYDEAADGVPTPKIDRVVDE